jgi:hypothetical protein
MIAALIPLLIAVLNFAAALFVWKWLLAESRTLRRVAFLIAALSISTLLFLGGVWPSLFTVLAIGVLPAAVGDLAGIFFPQAAGSRWFRIYSLTAVFLAATSYTVVSVFWFFGGVHSGAA